MTIETKWQTIEEFRDEEAELAIRVRELPLKRPKYSYEIGRVRDGEFKRYFSPRYQFDHGKVDMTPMNVAALTRLVARAETFIFTKLEEINDRFWERKISYEKRQIEREYGKKDQRKTGKTARKKKQKRS